MTVFLSLFDPCFFFDGLIAYAMAMVGLYLYLSTARETLRMRLCLGGAIAFILFGLAGAVASLFACCAFCCDLAGKSKKSLCSLSYVPFTLLLAWGAVRSGVMAQRFPSYQLGGTVASSVWGCGGANVAVAW